MGNPLKSRRATNSIRYLLDDWLPPVLREFRPLSQVLALMFHGRHFDLDFKRKALSMSDEEFAEAYARVAKGQKSAYRVTDMTEGQLRWMVRQAIGPDVLEVGCGYGVLAERLGGRGDLKVIATDLSPANIEILRRRAQATGVSMDLRVADVEKLPFPDKCFDTTLCAHTLEHVRRFEKAVAELVRVTRRRLLVVVPCQRYYRYTIDYHLHFFSEPEQLLLRMGLPHATSEAVDGDLCYQAELQPESMTAS
jgi:ubiquinone/menaquinone biosynthesis C-methylase UbiE